MKHNMGLGPLGETVFVRKFRYVLSGKHLSPAWNKEVNVNWSEKTITIKAYEVVVNGRIPIHDWANMIDGCGLWNDEELTLSLLDATGNELYVRKFERIKLVSRKNSYNYDSSDASLHEILLEYSICTEVAPEASCFQQLKKCLCK